MRGCGTPDCSGDRTITDDPAAEAWDGTVIGGATAIQSAALTTTGLHGYQISRVALVSIQQLRLDTLQGLNNLQFMGGDLAIQQNAWCSGCSGDDYLDTLAALSSLSYIGGNIKVEDNYHLESLSDSIMHFQYTAGDAAGRRQCFVGGASGSTTATSYNVNGRALRVKPYQCASNPFSTTPAPTPLRLLTRTHATPDAGAYRDAYAWTQPKADASSYTSSARALTKAPVFAPTPRPSAAADEEPDPCANRPGRPPAFPAIEQKSQACGTPSSGCGGDRDRKRQRGRCERKLRDHRRQSRAPDGVRRSARRSRTSRPLNGVEADLRVARRYRTCPSRLLPASGASSIVGGDLQIRLNGNPESLV